MPIYLYECKNGHRFDLFLKLKDMDREMSCECGEVAERRICAPAVQVDIPAYQSPTSGKWITSRSQRREDMRAANCVDYEPSLIQENERKQALDDATLARKIDEHVEETIYNMPTIKREKLVSELESGIDTEIIRV